jgi:(E)-4-hydroxy-3-methylbut-2-enyl-diphosphate synthase
MAERVERELEGLSVPIRVAVMGCAVNGPGEAREADIGLAGGRDGGLLFVKGKMVRRVPPERMMEELLKEIRKMASEMGEAGSA